MKWSEEMAAELIALHNSGSTAADISSRFFAQSGVVVSRNAVISKIHQLMGKGRIETAPLVDGKAIQRRHKAVKADRRHPVRLKLAPAIPPAVALHEDGPEPCTYPLGSVQIFDLGPLPPIAEKCRWPLGPTLAKAEFFCGALPTPGGVYCNQHARLSEGRG